MECCMRYLTVGKVVFVKECEFEVDVGRCPFSLLEYGLATCFIKVPILRFLAATNDQRGERGHTSG